MKATNAGGESNSSADVAIWDALPEELMDQQQRDVIFRELMDFPAVVSLLAIFSYTLISARFLLFPKKSTFSETSKILC